MRAPLAKLSKKLDTVRAKVMDKTVSANPETQPLAKQTRANTRRIETMKRALVLKRKWAYLRYLHTREALLLTEDVETVLVIGSGHGFAEITLALEFPEIHFHLTDIVTETTPNYHNAQRLADKWSLENVTFGIRNILVPEKGRYDMVTSVEVLEHIENIALAAAEMRAAANRYVYALVPFADEAANSDKDRRARLFETLGHYVVGYSEEDLRGLFPGIVAVRGCYWREHGGVHRKRLYDTCPRTRSTLTWTSFRKRASAI